MTTDHYAQFLHNHRLFSLDQVASIFSPDAKATPKVVREVEKLARQAGTYVAFADTLLFADRDIDAFVEWLRPRGAGHHCPLDNEDVMMVVIGSTLDTNAETYIGWAYIGHVDDLVKRVQMGAPGVRVLDFRCVSYSEYKLHLDSITSERFEGCWYHRTPKLNAWLLSVFATAENDNANDELRNETD